MSVPTLKAAYVKGLFPLAHVGSQKWWAPAERMVSFPDSVHISKNVRRLLRVKQFVVTFEPRPGRAHLTWIRPAYQALHDAGYAHSVEVWDRSGNLAGGLYGVAIGKVFFTESMFARQPDVSKVGLVTLSCHLQKWGFVLNDGKRDSAHLAKLGFRPIPRSRFNALLAEACSQPGRQGRWAVDSSIDVAQWDPKQDVLNA
jgi:leucyl/phenylalanyl-tRNA--protein transferase